MIFKFYLDGVAASATIEAPTEAEARAKITAGDYVAELVETPTLGEHADLYETDATNNGAPIKQKHLTCSSQFRFLVDTASPKFFFIIDRVDNWFVFYREELDDEMWATRRFDKLSDAYAHFAQQYKECGQ